MTSSTRPIPSVTSSTPSRETSAGGVRLDRVRRGVSGYIRRSSLQGLKRLTADDSSTTVRKYAVPGFLALSVAVFRSVSSSRSRRVGVAAPTHATIRCKPLGRLTCVGTSAPELQAKRNLIKFYLIYRFFSRPLGRLTYVGTSVPELRARRRKLFNKLPVHLKNKPSITIFMNRLRELLLEGMFYSSDEFYSIIAYRKEAVSMLNPQGGICSKSTSGLPPLNSPFTPPSPHQPIPHQL
ncbi:hypothetical protein J6590_013712 [Homalodisca vitripennis]|nr:hypothetical protein J6590_013712 [Homalodisca vitripennis]